MDIAPDILASGGVYEELLINALPCFVLKAVNNSCHMAYAPWHGRRVPFGVWFAGSLPGRANVWAKRPRPGIAGKSGVRSAATIRAAQVLLRRASASQVRRPSGRLS